MKWKISKSKWALLNQRPYIKWMKCSKIETQSTLTPQICKHRIYHSHIRQHRSQASNKTKTKKWCQEKNITSYLFKGINSKENIWIGDLFMRALAIHLSLTRAGINSLKQKYLCCDKNKKDSRNRVMCWNIGGLWKAVLLM